jgi:hypothetical protein
MALLFKVLAGTWNWFFKMMEAGLGFLGSEETLAHGECPIVTVKYGWKHPSMALNPSGFILMKIGNVFLVNDIFIYMAGTLKTTDMQLPSPSSVLRRSHRSKQPTVHVHWQERGQEFLEHRALPQTNLAQLEEEW